MMSNLLLRRPRARIAAAALATAIALGLAPAPAAAIVAPPTSGPFIVWVNFGLHDRDKVDIAIGNVLDGAEHPCWGNDALIYVHKRPPGMTDELVDRALYKHDTDAQRQLVLLMRRPFDDAPAFDLIVGYSDIGKTELTGMSSIGTIKSADAGAAHDEAGLRRALCGVMPPRQ